MNTPASNSAWLEFFPDEDYRFNFGIHAGDAAAFFAPTADHARLCTERRHWLDAEPEKHAAFEPEAAPLLEAVISLARQWRSLPADSALETGAMDAAARCRALGRELEADFLLLKMADDGRFQLPARAAAFPRRGGSRKRLDARSTSSTGRCRANWGRSRSPELHYHPDRALPRLAPPRVAARLAHEAGAGGGGLQRPRGSAGRAGGDAGGLRASAAWICRERTQRPHGRAFRSASLVTRAPPAGESRSQVGPAPRTRFLCVLCVLSRLVQVRLCD